MNNKELMRQISQLGFPLFEVEEELNINKTLSEVIKSRDLRLWEGFSVLLANTGEVGGFDYTAVESLLKTKQNKSGFLGCVLISLAVFKYFHLNFYWASQLYNDLSVVHKKRVTTYLTNLRKGNNIRLTSNNLSSIRIVNTFRNYFVERAAEAKKLRDHHEELSLEYSLSQIFSPKQKDLFMKKLTGEKMTKTEREYFSRTVKKKVLALSNPELHRQAQKVLSS